jgi:hypothetical protein
MAFFGVAFDSFRTNIHSEQAAIANKGDAPTIGAEAEGAGHTVWQICQLMAGPTQWTNQM